MNGGPGATSGAFLRGANRGQTLVLIDGLRVGSSSVGATSLEAIPLDQIERIEILRGPASSLYGADAIGGVIQVFTKQAEGSAFVPSAGAGYGTYDTRNASAGLRGALGPLRFSVQAGGTRSAGYNAIVNPDNFSYNGDRDGYAAQNAGLNAVLPWAAGQELAVQYFRNRLNNQYDGGPGFDDRTITTLEAWSVASRNRISDAWTSVLTAGRRQRRLAVADGFGDFPFKTTQRQYTWQNDLALPLGALAVILERREERLDTDAGFAVTERDTNSATGVYQLRYGAFAAAGEPAPRQLEPVRRQDHRRHRAGVQGVAGVARHRRLQHGLQGAVVQRPLLSVLLQSGPAAGDVAQHGGGGLLDGGQRRACAGRRAPSATTTRSTN